jgi:putative nucleotidyltransferase with HDIG domain
MFGITRKTAPLAAPSPADPAALDAIVEALQWFDPFKSLDTSDLLVLATKANIEHIPARQSLFKQGASDPWMFCLIEGTVELKAADGRVQAVVARGPAAHNPLSPLKPRQHTATTVTPTTCIRIDVSELGDIHDMLTQSHDDYSVHEFTTSAPVSDVVHMHELTLLSEGFVLPSLPAVALNVRRLIDDENATVNEVAQVVTKDPALTANLLKAANSALFRASSPIQNCTQAIMRLGAKTTRQLVTAFAVRNLFTTTQPELQKRMRAVWEHCNEVAAISMVIARIVKCFDVEEAMLAGLLHDIGMLPILNYAANHPSLIDDPVTFEQFVIATRVRAGVTVLQEWRLPVEMVTVVYESENWWRDSGLEPDLADVVLVAQIHSYLGKPERPNIPSMINLPAFRKLAGSGVTPTLSHQILTEAQEQIAEARQLLA